MSIQEYIAERKETRTCGEGIIVFKECKIERRWGGLQTILPDMPRADQEHHVVVMNFKGVHPKVDTILTNHEQSAPNLKTNELNKYLFVFVKIKPRPLRVSSPEGGYQLGDGNRINAVIDINYRIEDAKKFWMSADDPLAMFELSVVKEVKKYFLGITSEYLIRVPAKLNDDLETYIHSYFVQDSGLEKIKDILEKNIQKDVERRCSESGIAIIRVDADIQLSDSLSEHLRRLHETIYKPDGILEKGYLLKKTALYRNQVDYEIANDTTFFPYPLKKVIAALDTGLLENFYNTSWSEAMQKVHDKISEKRNSYLSKYKEGKIDALSNFIVKAEKLDLADEDVTTLKRKLFKEMNNEHEHDSPLFTDKKFLELIMQAHRIESNTSKHSSPQESSSSQNDDE